MTSIDKNNPPLKNEIQAFLDSIKFNLPDGFLDFFEGANGADITKDDSYILLWALTEMIQLNKEYNVEEYAPEFFVFGSDGGDTAYAIEKTTGYIFEMPFVGMSKEEAIFKSKTFKDFINKK